jgi:hypothetical protein
MVVTTNSQLTRHSTGVTGYIAGDALYALHQKHPDYEYAVLVRTQEKADVVKKAFPNVRTVLGGNDDSELLKEEAAKADIVLREPFIELHSISNTELIIIQMPQTPLTTRAPPKPSPRAFAPATRKRSPVTGCTPVAPAS